eukprot:1582595-Rhodomonas_salina.1
MCESPADTRPNQLQFSHKLYWKGGCLDLISHCPAAYPGRIQCGVRGYAVCTQVVTSPIDIDY